MAYGIPRPGIRSEAELGPMIQCEIPDPLTLFLEVTELVSWCCRDAANPTVPQWELQKLIVISS